MALSGPILVNMTDVCRTVYCYAIRGHAVAAEMHIGRFEPGNVNRASRRPHGENRFQPVNARTLYRYIP
eukprot:1320719-Pleurochrysis_carterae.AAC.1